MPELGVKHLSASLCTTLVIIDPETSEQGGIDVFNFHTPSRKRNLLKGPRYRRCFHIIKLHSFGTTAVAALTAREPSQ